ncbi:MAG: hypothetical protein ACTSYD_09985 [Candidatus Heimdallarchaeaceae archaeon]
MSVEVVKINVRKTFVLIISITMLCFAVNQTAAYRIDNVKLKFVLSNFNGDKDSKCIILVDVPENGGKATHYAVFEIKDTTTFWIYERGLEQDSHEGFLEPKLSDIDFIIFIDSKQGPSDTFDLIITSYDDDNSYSTYSYLCGDDHANDATILIFELKYEEDTNYFHLAYKRADAIYHHQDDPIYQNGYEEADWISIWQYLTPYFASGNEQVVENMLKNFSFPAKTSDISLPPGLG